MTTMLPSTLIKLQRVLTTSTTKITKRNCTILLQHHKLTKFNNNSKKHRNISSTVGILRLVSSI